MKLYNLLNHDLETYVYFSQYGHDHYVIKWTVSSSWFLHMMNFDEFAL